MNDEKIVRGIRQGDEKAVKALIDKYSKLLWTVADAVLKNIGNSADTEECVADTFIYFWEHPEKFDPKRGELKTWLCVIARTKAVNRSREISKHSVLSYDDEFFVEEMGIERTLDDETKRLLISAIESLKDDEREILIRRFYYDQKPKQIATALDISVKQVENRLCYTKQKLRKIFTGGVL